MVDYAESYIINSRTYGIEKDKKRLKVWSNGCCIGDYDNLAEARKVIHSHAVSQMRAEYHGHQERMVSAETALRKLGGDPFNLGWFRSLTAGK